MPSSPTPTKTHEAHVGEQFGARASAYLTSAVHSRGADLQALAALVEAGSGARVLDLGCGGGHVSYAASPRAREVVAYDLSPEMLEVVKRAAADRGLDNLVTQQGVVEHLPFADASFDYVLCRFSAHHWQGFDAALREAARVLKPGGVAGFVDSISPGVPQLDTLIQAIEVLRDPSHVRNYSRVEWEAAMLHAGLTPGTVSAHKLRLDFPSWIARMETPKVQSDAILALQRAASRSVAAYFDFAPDGTFNLDVGFFQATKAAF